MVYFILLRGLESEGGEMFLGWCFVSLSCGFFAPFFCLGNSSLRF